jgi:hypothetical protein
MKITRQQLRRLIAEAFKQKVPLFDPVTPEELESLRQTGRADADLSNLPDQQRAKLDILGQTEPNVQRSIYQALGSTEPELTVEDEESFLAGQDAMLQSLSDFNVKQYYGDISNYFTPSQIQILGNAAGKTLRMALATTDGGYFYLESDGTEIISPTEFHSMLSQIFNRAGGNPFDIHLDLTKKIIGASKKTFIHVDDFEDLGIGEFDEDGYYFYDSDFSSLDDRHKLTIDNG